MNAISSSFPRSWNSNIRVKRERFLDIAHLERNVIEAYGARFLDFRHETLAAVTDISWESRPRIARALLERPRVIGFRYRPPEYFVNAPPPWTNEFGPSAA
jgi:hypothetical protein